MSKTMIRRADILAKTLERFGVKKVFSLSGNHIAHL
jgi:thiamine pyrophosphate-dependent acetolactate synthase large subunit-like protein